MCVRGGGGELTQLTEEEEEEKERDRGKGGKYNMNNGRRRTITPRTRRT